MRNKTNLLTVGLVSIFFLPFFVFAQSLPNTQMLTLSAGFLVNRLLWILATLALVVFFWGIVKYIASAGNADDAKKGKSIMIYGAVALFVLFSIFGIIRFLQVEFGLFGPSAMYNPQVIQQGSTPGGGNNPTPPAGQPPIFSL